jgi:hypothetical protein
MRDGSLIGPRHYRLMLATVCRKHDMVLRGRGAINEITTAIASAVEQQGSATKEIARNVQEAA